MTTTPHLQQPQAADDGALIMHEVEDRGVIYQRIAKRTTYGAEISTRRLDANRQPLAVTSCWTLPPEEMDKLTAWWPTTTAESEVAK